MFSYGLIVAMGGRCFQVWFNLHCSVVKLLGDWTISVEFDSAAGCLSVDRQAAWRLNWRCWNILCFCQVVWQGLLWHSVVKLLGGRVHVLTTVWHVLMRMKREIFLTPFMLAPHMLYEP